MVTPKYFAAGTLSSSTRAITWLKICEMTGNNPNLDIANIIFYGETQSICSQDIEPKLNSDTNQGS